MNAPDQQMLIPNKAIKPTLLRLALPLLLFLSFARIASAFYDPSLGRWPNRDPIGESGFKLAARVHANVAYDDINPFLFVQNEALSKYDAFGLKKERNDFLILGEHRERDCPPCTRKKTNFCPFKGEQCDWPYEEQDCGKGKIYELFPGSMVAMRPRRKGEKPQVYEGPFLFNTCEHQNPCRHDG